MVQVKHDGSVKLINVNTVENKDGNLVAVSRSGELAVTDQNGESVRDTNFPMAR